MRSRSRVRARKDKRIFRRTAAATNVKNIPGKQNQFGGTRL